MIETLTVPKDTMTVEQFYEYCSDKEGRLELVNGKVVEMPPVASTHGRLDSRFIRLWADFPEEQGIGQTFINTGFILFPDRNLVRAPDQAFVSRERMEACPPPERGFWRVVPDLVVEIVSPDDSADDLNDKVGDYLTAGVRMIWVIYPTRKQVYVYRPGEDVRVIERDGMLTGDPVIPGLEIALARFWGA